MRRGTTPDYILTIPDHDLQGCAVFVTLRQNNQQVTLTGRRLNVRYEEGEDAGTVITFRLTQQETLGLHVGQGQVQVRWVDARGTAMCTEIDTVTVLPVLLEEVIEHEGRNGAEAG